ncbi:hypothetical protein FCV25MIE_32497 [Fagus crenata]
MRIYRPAQSSPVKPSPDLYVGYRVLIKPKVLSSHVLGLRHNIKEVWQDTDDVSLNLVTGGHWQSSYPPPPLSNYQGPTKQMQDIKEPDYVDVQDRMLKRIMPFLALPLTPIGVCKYLAILTQQSWSAGTKSTYGSDSSIMVAPLPFASMLTFSRSSHWKIYRHTTTIGGPEADLVHLMELQVQDLHMEVFQLICSILEDMPLLIQDNTSLECGFAGSSLKT